MGKVREEKSLKVPVDSTKKNSGFIQSTVQTLAGFCTNLLRVDRYKPTQGKKARLWTALGLGLIFTTGLYTFYSHFLSDQSRLASFITTLGLGLVFAWFIWRLVEYPPFADFLIATEAEMNKVSWTTKEDLIRATTVVLATVLLISIFLLGVDVLWSKLLMMIGVLRFDGGGGFGSQAG